MKYQTFPPSAVLEPFVRFFWTLESEDIPTNFTHRSLANGCSELIFHYKGSFTEIVSQGVIPQTYSMIHAQSQFYRRFETLESFGIFGAYLYPFTLSLLFSLPATDFSNQMPNLTCLTGPEGIILEERMLLAGDNLERYRILSHYLETRLAQAPIRDTRILKAIRDTANQNDNLDVKSLSDKYCFSVRQFERKFKEYAGFSPKLYMRIVRFVDAIEHYGLKDKTLSEIAYSCGYYDQSHFIHDFREFSGYHPKEYFRGKPEGTEYKQIV